MSTLTVAPEEFLKELTMELAEGVTVEAVGVATRVDLNFPYLVSVC